MAELKSLGRQIAQPNAPDISQAAVPSKALGQTVAATTKMIGAYVQEKRKVAEEMEAAVLLADTSYILNEQAVLQSDPANIAAGNAAGRYRDNAFASIDAATGSLNKERAAKLKLKLRSVVDSNSLKLLTQTKDYAYGQSKAAVETAADNAKRNYQDSITTGDKETIQQNYEDVQKIYDDGIELGIYNKKDKYEALRGLKETEIKERWYRRGENDAKANPGQAESQLEEVARNFPEIELTNTERILAITAYDSGLAFGSKQLQGQRAINNAEVSLGIENGSIQTPQDIYGKDVTALQGKNAEIALYKKQHKDNKKEAKIVQWLDNVQSGNGPANNRMSDDIKEAGHEALNQYYLEKLRMVSGDPEAELTIEDQAMILSQANTNRPSTDNSIEYAMQNADLNTEPALIEWALGMTRTVGKEKPNAIRMTEKTRALSTLANVTLQYGRSNPVKAIEGARAVVNVDEPILAGRKARQYKDGWEQEMRQAYREMTNANPNENPTSWGAYRQIYSTQALLTDSQEAAREATRQVMEPAFGESQYFKKGEYGYLPPEKIVPWAEQGHWLENQITLKLVDIAEANHKAPLDQISNLSKVELGGPKEVAQGLREAIASTKLDQNRLFDERIGPTIHYPEGGIEQLPITYRIKGQDRQVYIEADSSSRLNEGNKLTYTVYTIDPFSGLKEAVMDPRSKTGFASITIDSLDTFLPAVYSERNNTMFDKATADVNTEKYKKLNKIPIVRQFGYAKYLREHYKETRSELEKNEKLFTSGASE